MQIWRDQSIESGRLFRVEPEASPVIAQPANAKALETREDAGARLTRECRVVEHCLALTPLGVGPSEAAVIAVPDGNAPGIEPIENAVGGESGAITPVVIRTQISDRRYGQRVEAEPVAGPLDRSAKWLQHRALPLEIVFLRFAMADAEMSGVCSYAPD